MNDSDNINFMPFFPVISREVNGSVTIYTWHQIASQFPYWCEEEITQETSSFAKRLSQSDWKRKKKGEEKDLTGDNWKSLIEL